MSVYRSCVVPGHFKVDCTQESFLVDCVLSAKDAQYYKNTKVLHSLIYHNLLWSAILQSIQRLPQTNHQCLSSWSHFSHLIHICLVSSILLSLKGQALSQMNSPSGSRSWVIPSFLSATLKACSKLCLAFECFSFSKSIRSGLKMKARKQLWSYNCVLQ